MDVEQTTWAFASGLEERRQEAESFFNEALVTLHGRCPKCHAEATRELRFAKKQLAACVDWAQLLESMAACNWGARRARWQNDNCNCEWNHQVLHDKLVPLTGHPGTLGNPTVASLTELFEAWADDVCQERSDRQAPAPLELVRFVEAHNWYDAGKVVRLAIALEKVLRNPRVMFGQPEPFEEVEGDDGVDHADLEPEEPAPTDLELLRLYVRDKTRRGRSPTTLEKYDYALKIFLRENPAGFAGASRESIEAWIDAHMAKTDKKRGRKASHATWARRRYWLISMLSCFYDWAEDMGYLSENPARRIARPRLRRQLPRPMTDDDLALALGIADPQMRCFLLLGSLQGLRCQEIAGLDRDDVIENEMLLQITMGKGGNERMLPLHQSVLTALRGLPLPASGPLFKLPQGGRCHPYNVSHEINLYLHSLGIEATAHQLRHAFASNVYRVSQDLRLTQELMGHQSPLTTAIYAAFDPTKAAPAINALRVPRAAS